MMMSTHWFSLFPSHPYTPEGECNTSATGQIFPIENIHLVLATCSLPSSEIDILKSKYPQFFH